jgi:ParB family chromosome partitioning protein
MLHKESSVVSVNPFRCRMWALHDRLEDCVTEESCRSEIESFSAYGQRVPALGRSLSGDREYDVELIYGARRLFVARHLNQPLDVELIQMSDRDAIIAMDIENRQRTDISPYERGLSYARWLRRGFFESQDDIARALKISRSQVSRLLKLAVLPSVVVDSFRRPADICERWGLELSEALSDKERRDKTIQKARVIGAMAPRPESTEVFKQLLTASINGRKVKSRNRVEVVSDDKGKPLFRIRHQNSSIALLLPIEKVSAQCLQKVRQALSEIMKKQATREAGPKEGIAEMESQEVSSLQREVQSLA